MIPAGPPSQRRRVLEVMNGSIGFSILVLHLRQREEFEIGTKKRKQVLKQNNYKLKKKCRRNVNSYIPLSSEQSLHSHNIYED